MPQARKQPGVERIYRDDRIEVTWEPSLCIHFGACYGQLPEVFRPRERPWVRLEEASADEIARVVQDCPTGALGFTRLDGGPQEEVPDEPLIDVDPKGPLYIRGRLRIERDGELLREGTRVALCRCGQSGNKPFCDNTHLKIGFTDEPDTEA